MIAVATGEMCPVSPGLCHTCNMYTNMPHSYADASVGTRRHIAVTQGVAAHTIPQPGPRSLKTTCLSCLIKVAVAVAALVYKCLFLTHTHSMSYNGTPHASHSTPHKQTSRRVVAELERTGASIIYGSLQDHLHCTALHSLPRRQSAVKRNDDNDKRQTTNDKRQTNERTTNERTTTTVIPSINPSIN